MSAEFAILKTGFSVLFFRPNNIALSAYMYIIQ
jgi:hypothetical protein